MAIRIGINGLGQRSRRRHGIREPMTVSVTTHAILHVVAP